MNGLFLHTTTRTMCHAGFLMYLLLSFVSLESHCFSVTTTSEHSSSASYLGRLEGILSSSSSLSAVSTTSKEEETTIEQQPQNIDLSSSATTTRAIEIASIVSSQIVSPLIISLLRDGLPENWNEFWGRSNDNDEGKSNRIDSNNSKITNGQRIAMVAEELGPTYVKFGQALASRPDVIPPTLASALETLQDKMEPFSYDTAQQILQEELSDRMSPEELSAFCQSLGTEPVGAASIGQVYKGILPQMNRTVAVKIKRKGIQDLVQRDAQLLRSIAQFLESIPSVSPLQQKSESRSEQQQNSRLIATELVDAVEEFFQRIFEEMDYYNEAKNCQEFAQLYSIDNKDDNNISNDICVIVPEMITEFCTSNVLVMEWVDGTKLTDVDKSDPTMLQENLDVVSVGIECTLSQLLETGRLHADPHAGNLLKVKRGRKNKNNKKEEAQLAYLDFGILATVPEQVRDALVCAVSYLVFANDVEAIASLFGELQLLPEEIVSNPTERKALTTALTITLNEALVYEEREGISDNNRTISSKSSTLIPTLKFDKLLNALTLLVPRFQFQLPPYFINNARALSTLEGIARSLDPNFNVFTVMYPIALNKLLTNPSQSPVVDRTLQDLIRDSDTREVNLTKVSKLLQDSALLTGYRKRKVLYDIVLKTKGGRKFATQIMKEYLIQRVQPKRRKNWKPSNFLRL